MLSLLSSANRGYRDFNPHFKHSSREQPTDDGRGGGGGWGGGGRGGEFHMSALFSRIRNWSHGELPPPLLKSPGYDDGYGG